MMQSTIPAVQVKTEQLFSEAKGKCHNILTRHKNKEDQEALISSDESEDDISLFAVPQADDSVQIMAIDGYIADHIPEACGAAARLLGIYAR